MGMRIPAPGCICIDPCQHQLGWLLLDRSTYLEVEAVREVDVCSGVDPSVKLWSKGGGNIDNSELSAGQHHSKELEMWVNSIR